MKLIRVDKCKYYKILVLIASAYAQSRLNLRCSHTHNMNVDEAQSKVLISSFDVYKKYGSIDIYKENWRCDKDRNPFTGPHFVSMVELIYA